MQGNLRRVSASQDFFRFFAFCCCWSESPGMLGKPQAATLDFTITFFFNSNTNPSPMVFVMTVTIISHSNKVGDLMNEAMEWQSFKKMTHVLICLNANCLLQAKISANHSCPSTFFVYVCQQAKSRKSSRNVSSQMKEKFYRSFPTNYF